MAIVLSAKGVFSKYINDQRNLDDFFMFVNSLHKNNIPSVKREFSFKDRNVLVTLGFASSVEPSDKDITTNDGTFFPAFVLYRGYDHRASEYIFSTFSLKAQLKENLKALDVYDLLLSHKAEYFLASIRSKFTDKDATIVPTHIVVVQRVFIDQYGIKMLEYVDPAEKDKDTGTKQIKVEDFEHVFNGFGTAVN